MRIKKDPDAIKQLEEELEGINNFQSQSEHQFIVTKFSFLREEGMLQTVLQLLSTLQLLLSLFYFFFFVVLLLYFVKFVYVWVSVAFSYDFYFGPTSTDWNWDEQLLLY